MLIKRRLLYRSAIFSTLFFILNGCLSINKTNPPKGVPWSDLYQPIVNAELLSFSKACIDEAVSLYGDPIIPITKVDLRRSRKHSKWNHLHIAEDFSLAELVSGSNGNFVIYLGFKLFVCFNGFLFNFFIVLTQICINF